MFFFKYFFMRIYLYMNLFFKFFFYKYFFIRICFAAFCSTAFWEGATFEPVGKGQFSATALFIYWLHENNSLSHPCGNIRHLSRSEKVKFPQMLYLVIAYNTHDETYTHTQTKTLKHTQTYVTGATNSKEDCYKRIRIK